MKLNNFIKSTLMAGLLLTASACREDVFDIDGKWDGKVPDSIDLNLVIPDPQVVNIGETRAAENVTSVNVLLYDADGGLITNFPLDRGFNMSGTVIRVTVPLDPATKSIQIVANAADEVAGQSDPSAVWVSGERANPVFWGEAPVNEALEAGTMVMLRNTAKVTVKSNLDNFEILEVGVFGTSKEGSIAPAADNIDPEKKPLSKSPTVKAGMEYLSGGDELMKTSNNKNNFEVGGFYETPADLGGGDFTRVIIKGKYTDAAGASIDGYYVVSLRDREGSGPSEIPGNYTYKDRLPMLRNHNYVVNITEVRSEGWPQLSQAKTAKEDNRLTVYVEDKSPNVTDIEASRDYYLGIGNTVFSDYNDCAYIDISTSYPGLNGEDKWYQRLSFETDDDWIKVKTKEEVSEAEKNDYITVENEEINGDVISLKLRVPLEVNPEPVKRYGWIKIRAGKLSRDLTISQEACPYNRRREVILSGLTKGGEDFPVAKYFSFIDGVEYDENGNKGAEYPDYVRGLKKEENRNANRNGLHFPAVPLYDNVTYKIAKKENDGQPTFVTGNDDFECSSEGNYWVVKMKNPNTIKITTGKLRIPSKFEGHDVNVDYDIFRTGIFHCLTDDMLQYQPAVEEVQKKGWYYYEVVKVGNSYVLDRDLGASSNLPYSPGASQYKQNSSALGGYFKPNTEKWSGGKNLYENKNVLEDQETITKVLGLEAKTAANGKFVMASEADLNAFNMSCGTIVRASAIGKVAGNTIYFPKAGYYEGDEFKSTQHCMFWTRTYLGGTQGLAASSPEFGYWYRYFDDMKSTTAANRYSNVRMARGSNGIVPDDESVWRYMPLRLVWVVKDNSLGYYINGTGTVSSGNTTVSGKMVIYFKDAQNWSNIRYHVWDVASGGTTWNGDAADKGLPLMPAVSGQTNLYRIEVGAPTKSASGILFRYNNDGQTDDFKELYRRYRDGETVLVLTQDGNGLKVIESGDSEDIINPNPNPNPDPNPDPTPTLTKYRFYWKSGYENDGGTKERDKVYVIEFPGGATLVDGTSIGNTTWYERTGYDNNLRSNYFEFSLPSALTTFSLKLIVAHNTDWADQSGNWIISSGKFTDTTTAAGYKVFKYESFDFGEARKDKTL